VFSGGRFSEKVRTPPHPPPKNARKHHKIAGRNLGQDSPPILPLFAQKFLKIARVFLRISWEQKWVDEKSQDFYDLRSPDFYPKSPPIKK
jgi:hypothetical protein